MTLTATVVIYTVAFCFVYLLTRWYRRPKNAPPGPRGIPFIGMGPFFGTHPASMMARCAATYGNVMSLGMGAKDFLVLSDLESITEAFVRQSENFAGRPQSKFFEELTGGYGIVFRDISPQWKVQKRFGLQALHRLRMGKHLTEDKINAELNVLLEKIVMLKGEPFDVISYLTQHAAKVAANVLMGKQYEYGDNRLQAIIDNIPKKTPILFMPWLRHIPPFKAIFKREVQTQKKVIETIKDLVGEHETNYDPENHRDFIDEYLNELLKVNRDESFEYAQCYQYVVDLLVGSIDSTKASISWGIICLIHFPEHQVKLQEELDRVLDPDEQPSLSRLQDLPFLHAFITEVSRWKTVAPTGVPHVTKCNVCLNGYDIPANTMVMANIWQVHNDERFWSNPGQFRPERHLDENGKFVRSRHIIPFSLGQRRCGGEPMAKAQLFLFYVKFLRCFTFECDPSWGFPSFDTDKVSLFETPKRFQAIARAR